MRELSEVSPDELRALQLALLAEVDRVCRAEGIDYYLAFGSLLGAVRHGGFIPWDDDVDVMLRRPDYERLLDVLDRGSAAGHVSVLHAGTRAGWPLPYAKVSDDRTDVVEPFEAPVQMGVNVDVFPLDPLPANRGWRTAQHALLRLLRWAVELRYISAERGRGWHGPIALRVAKPLLRWVPLPRLVSAFERIARTTGRPSDREGVRVGSFDWSVPRSTLGTPTELGFAGLSCLVPHDPDAVLTTLYGDYRRLPDAHEQVTHHSFTATWRDEDPVSGDS